MLKVVPIPILNDNYIWTIIHDKKTVVVDPGLSDPVLNYHQKNNLELTAILITHHHHDHIGGIDGIINQCNVPVYAPKCVLELPLRKILMCWRRAEFCYFPGLDGM